MPFLQTHFWPGGTEEQYAATVKVVHPESGLPAGQLMHVAGPSEGGYLISVLWESKDQSDAFLKDTLMPAMPVDGGFSGRPDEHTAEVAHHEAA